jgi:hypothetical protein
MCSGQGNLWEVLPFHSPELFGGPRFAGFASSSGNQAGFSATGSLEAPETIIT